MALTAQQDIPNKPEVKEPWTFRRLFPFAGAVSAITKVFVNPLDILLGFIILVIGLVELFGRHVSWGFYILAILILVSALFERHVNLFLDTKPEEKQ
ncbi:MAG: hypothetical protein UW07_C0044G0014 [Candidatus Nomurabacteria bacterium GW2011_GWF2_43_8]|uniref:Uncharacterized protein n=2 Tax=Candidatus Nomuraibacteriota TaxID=1752729 RepID=A0A0G1IG33_9BACT|nr:MAG: hypothetical protein UW02_C0002G0008 [Candidatus Nomurabacteria bacterium GW2011_GWB1_43_7]KKT22129.1 MAG: hypothetical protein UW07_C0044G0014 [Candidatus Nomurabacteria bacterium GW2011_GWF2_43_8]